MIPRNIYLPRKLWTQLEQRAVEFGATEGKPVSVAETVRRILERSMKRRKT